MNADLLGRYGRRFIESARERLVAVGELDGPGALVAARALALHLHSISGESAMIGLTEVSQLARTAMQTAREVEAEPGRAIQCAAEIGRLSRALDELEARLPPR
jgi:HPt (histidine-containing phosphotransfer) domain-containing protein